MSTESDVLDQAEAIEQHLRRIRRLMRSALHEDMRSTPLTRPQMHVLAALTHTGAMSLKALSRHLALAHSTVSGIVDRLEQRGLVRRELDPHDRRGVRIAIGDSVEDYLRDVLPARRLGPLLQALRNASDEERRCVLDGIATLHRLLERSPGQEQQDARAGDDRHQAVD